MRRLVFLRSAILLIAVAAFAACLGSSGLAAAPVQISITLRLGVSTGDDYRYAIFGDMNQQGAVSGPKCSSSQNGRGGLFYMIDDSALADSLGDLIKGETAPTGSQ